MDGSHHVWLEDRGPKMVLMGLVDDVETLVLDAQVLEEILKDTDPVKRGKEIEIKLIARLRKHLGNPKFTALGERLVQKELRRALLKYKLHTDQEIFDRAYGYIRQYYGVGPWEAVAYSPAFSFSRNGPTRLFAEK